MFRLVHKAATLKAFYIQFEMSLKFDISFALGYEI